jgi:photosystem II stability/assembly factor-like uncharacterized protein
MHAMKNARRALALTLTLISVGMVGLGGDAAADPPMWASPFAVGPHDTGTLAARPGLLLASGTANHVDAYSGGGIQPAPGPRVAGVFRSTDQGRTWTQGKKVGPEGELSTITSPPDVLGVGAADAYAAFGSQAWRSSDEGATWRSVGVFGGTPSTLDVLVDGRVVAGLTGGGLRVSGDRGETWNQLGTGLPSARVNEVHVLPSGTVLVATDTGLYRSTNAGGSFAQVTTGIVDPAAIAYGVASESTSAILLAMEGENAGTAIYTSTNDGASFQPRPIVAASGASPRATRGAVEATVQGSLFVFYVGTPAGLFRTGNAGVSTFTWERVDPEPGYRSVLDLAIEDTDPTTGRSHLVYAALRRASPVAVSASDTRMVAPGWFDQLEGGRICGGMVSRPDGALFVACGRHIFRSDDQAQTWSSVTRGLPYLHPIGDTPYFPLVAGPDGSLWVSGFDRGLYHSNAAVTSWSKVPLPAASTGVVEAHPTNAQVVYAAGLGTNGSREVLWRTTNGGTAWEPIHEVGRTINSVDIAPAAPNRVLVSTNSSGWVSEDGGETWTKAIGLPASSIYGALYHVADPTVAWAIALSGGDGTALYRSTDAGRTWNSMGEVKLNGQSKFSFDFTPSPWDPDTVYLPLIDGDLIATHDAGSTFERVDAGLPKDSCSICETVDNMTFDSRARGVMYVTAGILDPNNGPQSNWVYRATDTEV